MEQAAGFVRLTGYNPQPTAVHLLPELTARRYNVAPLWMEDGQLVLACTNPADTGCLRMVSTIIRRPVRLLLANYVDVRALNDRIYTGSTQHAPSPDIGNLLVKLGYLRPDQVKWDVQGQAGLDEQLAAGLLHDGLITENQLAEAKGWQVYLPHVRSESMDLPADLCPMIPWDMAKESKILPLYWLHGTLVVGTPLTHPTSFYHGLAEKLGVPVRPVICPLQSWEHLYLKFYLSGEEEGELPDMAAAEWLVKQGILSEVNLEAAQALSQQLDQKLEHVLINDGIIDRQDWLNAQAHVLKNFPLLNKTAPIRRLLIGEQPSNEGATMGQNGNNGRHAAGGELAALLPRTVAYTHGILPLECDGDRVVVGMAKPSLRLEKMVHAITDRQVETYFMDPVEVEAELDRLYSRPPTVRPEIGLRLGEMLLALKLVTPAQLDEALEGEWSMGMPLGARLIQLGYLDDVSLAEVFSVQSGIPYIKLDKLSLKEDLVQKIPGELAQKHVLLPIWSEGADLWVVIADPFDGTGLIAVEQITHQRVWPLVAPRSQVSAAIERFFGQQLRAVDPRLRQMVDRLQDTGYLTQAGATETLYGIAVLGLPFDRAIRQASGLAEMDVASKLAELLQLPLINLDLREEVSEAFDPLGNKVLRRKASDPVDSAAAHLINLETAQRLTALPVSRSKSHLQVAFASPPLEVAIAELEATLGLRVRPVLAMRSALEHAIQRTLGRRNIGTYLMLEGIITRSQLNDALDLAQRTGVRLGKALVIRRFISDEQLSRFLAQQVNWPFFDLRGANLDRQVAAMISPDDARKYGVLPLARDGDKLLVAMVDPLNDEALEAVRITTGCVLRPVLVSEQSMEDALERLYQEEYLARSVSELLERSPEDSAYKVLSRGQQVTLIAILVVSLVWALINFNNYIIVLNSLATIFYLAFSTYKFYLVYHAASSDLEIPVSEAEIAALDDRTLPVYTVLIPVYREAEVLSELLESISHLDYPKTKLDIKVLMEMDDVTTIEKFHEINPPSYIQGIVVPTAQPKTKPKACNYGLIHARGDYLVIFDAEDLPDRDQLKKILIGFSKAAPEVACIQSKLNYYNSRQNVLTRWFTVEYSMWFDLFLPGLDASHAPIPLGGTSNHFKREALIDAGAWDPYNVTEDADLGIRMYKRGYRTAIVDSTTYEEANSQIYNWIRQRSRWIKGYIQTWLVHMRHPFSLWREIGWKSFLSFQFVVGGTFFAAILNPVYWILTTLWFFTHWPFIQAVFPSIVFYAGAICLYFGNFAFTFMNVAGAMRRGYYDMVKYALLSPLYWGLMSIGAWKGFLQLITRPHFWEKTVHGLYRGGAPAEGSQEQQANS